ncbi:MarP family serine protease [Agromyces seonyuensis]|uniref:MarP family serine protease n=1 Tax=Agromyces seonyuensis TaxID=2662446 RepID=A0A6I4P6Y0_9MICO|nr:MarP family serine protease [Agromyces seonyuensis]MWB99467.1 MarP family serine protease [Agromyces seonyuensis]
MGSWDWLVDVVFLLILLAGLLNGVRAGLFRTAGALIGLVAGGIAAFFAMPWVMTLPLDPLLRSIATVFVGVLLLAVGAGLGGTLGRFLGSGAEAVHLGWLDRILGGAAGIVASAFAILLVFGGIGAMGIPGVSPAFANSRVLAALEAVTPEPVSNWAAQVRGAATDQAVPWLADVLDAPTETPEQPDFAVDDPEVLAASDSVVRITGTAYQCGVGMTGSGFVVAEDRIVTNAHVVAGLESPLVEAPDGETAPGRIVAFDPANDLAVIATDGLGLAPLAMSSPLEIGAQAVVAGYPLGGPLDLQPANVVSSGVARIVVDGAESQRDIVTIAGTVEHGNSGGPLLTMDGTVAGVVFAKSETVSGVGFAIAPSLLDPLAAQSAELRASVSTGSCTG